MRSAATFLALVASACGSAAPPRSPPPASDPEVPRELVLLPGPASVEAEIGGMSQHDVEQSLARLHPRFIRCVEQASQRLPAIGGRVNVRLRVERNGRVRWAYLSDSTLGDRDAETCVLELVKSRRWPRPKGGEGLAETSFEVDAADAPHELTKTRASWFAQRAGSATRSCRKGMPGGFFATAYVAATGQVLSAGVAPSDERGEDAADCIAGALKNMTVRGLVREQEAPAKVSVRIP